MKRLLIFFLFSTVANAECKYTFGVIWQDRLGNVTSGLEEAKFRLRGSSPGAEQKWLKHLAKKYPEICYAAPRTQPVNFIFRITASQQTAQRSREYTTSDTTEQPVDGTVYSTYGQEIGTVHGTVEQTTTTTHVQPYIVDYDSLILKLEHAQNGKFQTVHYFSSDTLCYAYLGKCVTNRHPDQGLMEQAVKWIHNGGVADPAQTVVEK